MSSLFTNAANGNTAGTAASQAVAGNGGNQSDMFTKLLVAQIRNQNPLEPTDPSEFVAQLTQMSQMEAMQTMAAQNASSASTLQGLQTLGLGAQVGSDVTVFSDRVTLGSAPVTGNFTLTSASKATAVVLTGADGVAHRIELGTQAPGSVPFTIDRSKHGLAAGPYAVRIDTGGDEHPPAQLAGTLKAVRLSGNGSVVLDVNGIGETTPESITGFIGRATPH